MLTSGRECVLSAHTSVRQRDRPTDRPTGSRLHLFVAANGLFLNHAFCVGVRELALTKIAFKSRLIRREVALQSHQAHRREVCFIIFAGHHVVPSIGRAGRAGKLVAPFTRSERKGVFLVATEFLSPDILVLLPRR